MGSLFCKFQIYVSFESFKMAKIDHFKNFTWISLLQWCLVIEWNEKMLTVATSTRSPWVFPREPDRALRRTILNHIITSSKGLFQAVAKSSCSFLRWKDSFETQVTYRFPTELAPNRKWMQNSWTLKFIKSASDRSNSIWNGFCYRESQPSGCWNLSVPRAFQRERRTKDNPENTEDENERHHGAFDCFANWFGKSSKTIVNFVPTVVLDISVIAREYCTQPTVK